MKAGAVVIMDLVLIRETPVYLYFNHPPPGIIA
jgi:hypothetical protein